VQILVRGFNLAATRDKTSRVPVVDEMSTTCLRLVCSNYRSLTMAKKRHYDSMSPSAERDVVEEGGQRGSSSQGAARHENAFGNMSFDKSAVAGLPRGVRMEEYPHVGVFLSLDDNLGGSREGIDAQMREDQSQLEKQIRPRKI
jgi:hypothetical protein